MNKTRKRQAIILCAAGIFCINAALAAQPVYEIIGLGIAGEANSGAQAVSQGGAFVSGFTDSSVFFWESGGSSVAWPPLGLSLVFADDFESYLEGDSLDTDNPASPYHPNTNGLTGSDH